MALGIMWMRGKGVKKDEEKQEVRGEGITRWTNRRGAEEMQG